MATFCYTWDNADVFWNTVELTWAEFCVVEKALGVVGGSQNRRLKKELTDEEQQIIIDLFVRIKDQDIEFEKRMNKHKNKKTKVTIKDVEMLLREAKKIDVKIFM
jgi:DNA replication initiation complex subunit (GINS family)